MIAYFYTGQCLAIANECDFNREDIIKWSVPSSSSSPPSEESDSYLVTGMRLFPGHGFIFLPLPRAEKTLPHPRVYVYRRWGQGVDNTNHIIKWSSGSGWRSGVVAQQPER